MEQQQETAEESAKKLKDESDKLSSNASCIDEKPDYLLPQFKSIEEQAKSYKELQALQTRQAQELANYKRANANVSQINNDTSILNYQLNTEKQKLKNIYANEVENLKMALSLGKISKNEAEVCFSKLKDFAVEKLANIDFKYKNLYEQLCQSQDMVSPKDFFQNDLLDRNYLSPVCEFLESNYKKMSRKDLEKVKNLANSFEKSLREEILNESDLSESNESYRQNLTSAANLNPQKFVEKIYTMDEIKNMKPDEFRKNQRTILEQFVAHKIK